MNRNIVFFLIFYLIGAGASAQTLDEQFHDLKENNETFKSYKVIKETELDAFWKTVLDSASQVKSDLRQAKNNIKAQKSELDKHADVISDKDKVIADKEYSSSHIEVLGIDIVKESYKIINFTIIVILLIALAILLYKFKDNNRIARKKSNDYDRLNTEYETYKRNALEKQMKLRRDLQTERNKLDDIRS